VGHQHGLRSCGIDQQAQFGERGAGQDDFTAFGAPHEGQLKESVHHCDTIYERYRPIKEDRTVLGRLASSQGTAVGCFVDTTQFRFA
jgi:hypothetical protein